MRQIIEHMERNKLIAHQHHGAVHGKSTQTMVVEIYDKLLENLQNDDDTALIMLDQSKAYKIICHKILLRKLRAIGFTEKATKMVKSFLEERRQYVQIQGQKSETLSTGPQSVVQGSSLSCILFLVYILDLPQVFHETPHPPRNKPVVKNQASKLLWMMWEC